jgi:polyphosphate kinase
MSDAPAVTEAPELFFNRELSWLAFNERVLEEARDPANPLLERVKFTTIVASNLDEFFMVRVAGLKHAVSAGEARPDPAGLTPTQQLSAISERAHAMVAALYSTVLDTLLPPLSTHGIRVLAMSQLDPAARAAIKAYFHAEVLPALTPLAIDFARPFPMLSSLSLNLAFCLPPAPAESLQSSGPSHEASAPGTERRLAIVQAPPLLPRLIRLAGPGPPAFVLLEDVIRSEFEALFPGQTRLEAVAFRLTRDAEVELDDEGGQSYVEALEQELRKRRRSAVVRLEIEGRSSEAFCDWLTDLVGVAPEDVYRLPGLLDIRALGTLVDLPG